MTTLSTRSRRRPASALIITGILCTVAAISFASKDTLAAEKEPAPQAQGQADERSATEATGQAQAETKEPATRPKETDKNKEIFRPSEEISEDFAVSFPVDI